MYASASPLCLKCHLELGSYIHCFWSCLKMQDYWAGILVELCKIFNVQVELNPMCLLLGFPDTQIIDVNHKRLYSILTFAARKNILMSWINNSAPSRKSWHKIIMECIPHEYLTCILHVKTGAFFQIWQPYLVYIGPTLASAIMQGFPHQK